MTGNESRKEWFTLREPEPTDTSKYIKNMAEYTKAKFLQDPEKKTPVFVRFSTVVGSKGSANSLRDPRGFAVKFYTEDGNYDLVGNNLPVFFIRDAIKFPDMVHAFKPAPNTNISDDNRFWDFISLTPESTHMITCSFPTVARSKAIVLWKALA